MSPVSLKVSHLVLVTHSWQASQTHIFSSALLCCLSPTRHKQDSEALLQCEQHENVLTGEEKKSFLPQIRNQTNLLWRKLRSHQGKTTGACWAQRKCSSHGVLDPWSRVPVQMQHLSDVLSSQNIKLWHWATWTPWDFSVACSTEPYFLKLTPFPQLILHHPNFLDLLPKRTHHHHTLGVAHCQMSQPPKNCWWNTPGTNCTPSVTSSWTGRSKSWKYFKYL